MTITLGIPQVIYILLMIAATVLAAAKHGQPQGGNHNVWTTLTAQIIVFSILYAGGFFSNK